MNWTVGDLLEAIRMMSMIRTFEERLEELFYAGRIRGSVHLAIGQEGVAVGACRALDEHDVVVPTYRGHAWALAKGIHIDQVFGEVLGKQTGSNKGRGGSKHVGDISKGVMPGNAIVGATVPLAAGFAYAAKLDRSQRVAVASFGDGAANQGSVHEAMNLASLYRLPLIMVCENNLYAEMTPREQSTAIERISERAIGYRIPAVEVDGMDIGAVAEATVEAATRARNGEGPTLIEAMTYRFCGHMPGDMQTYRTKEEVENWRKSDPLLKSGQTARALGATDAQVTESMESGKEAVRQAENRAEEAALPNLAEIGLGAPGWEMEDRVKRLVKQSVASL